ncbi:DUF1292 domain-containing protein [Rossellomorea oryzaecorticis]|uniref:DUF1292 domain-containing protein n=1 Tax=Rossellomorea oryzaecorticis TaxID=1396505 RepID=A0ABU9KCM9_9BACI
MERKIRDSITVIDEKGSEIHLYVEALFDMFGETYALLKTHDENQDMIVMRVENDGSEQYLESIEDPNTIENILDAYEIAVDAQPIDQNFNEH